MANITSVFDRFFGITAAGSTTRREVIGGLTTFATMSYIVFVQPAVLSVAGMPFGAVMTATCLSSAFACLLMGLLARYPFALAPGMGENFLFAFTVCGAAATGGMGFSWQAGLAIVFISGVLFMLLSLFAIREKMMLALPDCLKNAIGPGIGLFIAFVGFQWGGIVVHSPATMVAMGSFHKAVALITAFSVLVIAVCQAREIRGGILIGIACSTGLCLLTGVIPYENTTGADATLSFATCFQLDFRELVANWHNAIIAIALFFFLDFFDTVGTLVGVGKQAGFIGDDGVLPRAERAFFADATATAAGALLGTSTVTSYIESATGVAAGARTGLAAVVTGICFAVTVFAAPIVHLAGANIGPAFYGADSGVFVAMYPAVAPALIVVGFLMAAPLARIKWDDITESMPAFLTVVLMVFGYGITEGISMGCVSFVLIKMLAGRFRDIHPIMYAVGLAFLARYAFLAGG